MSIILHSFKYCTNSIDKVNSVLLYYHVDHYVLVVLFFYYFGHYFLVLFFILTAGQVRNCFIENSTISNFNLKEEKQFVRIFMLSHNNCVICLFNSAHG